MLISAERIKAAANKQMSPTTAFAQQMIQTPSLPGKEQDIAAIIYNQLNALGFDNVWTDEMGNVMGRIKGGNGPTVLLNGHMDHVDPGPTEGWPYAPFSGQIVGDELWGRGSVDMKGPVACMIYAAALFKILDVTPPGDILMTVPVMEEVGGLGTQYLANRLQAQAAICGEPSHNTLRRGHRGRVEIEVTFKGRSAHASVPHLGRNPHYQVTAFLNQLPQLVMATQEAVGISTVTPTLYATDQISPNVIPGQVILTLDWRNVPSESPQEIVEKIEALIDTLSDDIQASVEISHTCLTTYTGVEEDFPAVFPSFLLTKDDPLVQVAHTALVNVLGRDDGVDIWKFATDGGHLMAAGIPTIGFGPGDETLAHTNQERISLAQMEEAVVAYVALILALAEAAES